MSIVIIFAILSVLRHSYGVPLENTSEDLSRYFTPRIVGGEDAPKAFAPHMAALVISDHFKLLMCGGSIVTPKLILTAAHCIEPFVIWGELLQTFHATVGSNRWDGDYGHVVKFNGYHMHPQWDHHNIKYDAGFLMLEEKLKMNEKVGVIALNFGLVGGDETSYVTGWGRLGTWGIIPYQLQILYVRTLSHEECVHRMEAVSHWGSPHPKVQADVEICTFHSIGHGMCNGDSGSALVKVDDESQIGIVSWGFACAHGLPDVFVRISGIKDYIEMIMKGFH